MKCEYKVERISGELEKYLNEKGRQGWRCVSVTTATGLGWTHIVVLEQTANDDAAEDSISPEQEECKKVSEGDADGIETEQSNEGDIECLNGSLDEAAIETDNIINIDQIKKRNTESNPDTQKFLEVATFVCFMTMFGILLSFTNNILAGTEKENFSKLFLLIPLGIVTFILLYIGRDQNKKDEQNSNE